MKGTRVTLDSILHAYNNDGATAEEIVYRFPSCTIEDVYTVISWALNNPKIVIQYLREQQEKASQYQLAVSESNQGATLRERLIARATNLS